MTDKELYNCEVAPIPQDIVDERVKALDEHLKLLMSQSWKTRDNHMVSKILNAKEFWYHRGELQ